MLVVFVNKSSGWGILPKDFQHVFTLEYFNVNGAGYWLYTDYNRTGLKVTLYQDFPSEETGNMFFIDYMLDKYPTCRIQHAPRKAKATNRYSFGFMHCVEVAKQQLGISAWWLQTPKQLYNYLEKRKHTCSTVTLH